MSQEIPYFAMNSMVGLADEIMDKFAELEGEVDPETDVKSWYYIGLNFLGVELFRLAGIEWHVPEGLKSVLAELPTTMFVDGKLNPSIGVLEDFDEESGVFAFLLMAVQPEEADALMGFSPLLITQYLMLRNLFITTNYLGARPCIKDDEIFLPAIQALCFLQMTLIRSFYNMGELKAMCQLKALDRPGEFLHHVDGQGCKLHLYAEDGKPHPVFIREMAEIIQNLMGEEKAKQVEDFANKFP